MSINRKFRDSLFPNSIFARMAVTLLVGILLAQSLGAWLWIEQLKDSERKRFVELSENMGSRIGQTIQFFIKLPKEYRHIVLDQLRDMGGTRFFVSVNQAYIDLPTLEDNEFSTLVRERLVHSIKSQLGGSQAIDIQFVKFDELKILSGTNLMVDLPPKWKRFALIEPSNNSPIALIQMPIANEWLYLASPVPSGDLLVGINWLTSERLISLASVSLTVLLLTLLTVRWLVRPLRRLAKQARNIGQGRSAQQVEVEGSREMVATINAFNKMSLRIQKFISDRERLFAAISHDLKTPLTRVRLRTELLEDESVKEALISDLDNLDTMVKGSLQMMKEDVVHENSLTVAIDQMLLTLAEKEKIHGLPVHVDIQPGLQLEGRPMALERLFANLISNGLEYGGAIYIKAWSDESNLWVTVSDPGPGLKKESKDRVFEPYYRIDQKPNSSHSGLGLSIARSIAHFHGGEISLLDAIQGGLCVRVNFPL